MADDRASPWVFFGLTALFFAPWPVLATVVAVPGLPKNAPVTDFVAAFCPAAAAIVLTARREGRAGVRRLLRRLLGRHRIPHPAWYLPILLLPAAGLGLTAAASALLGLEFRPQPALSPAVMPLFVAVFLVAAAGEELGWSGYALEPLCRRRGALGGALVLGLVWWSFHVPSILQSGQDTTLVLLGLLGTLATRVVWTWLFLGTGGSVVAMVLVHTAANVCGSFVPSVPTAATGPVTAVLAILVVGLCGPSLRRGRLRCGRR